MVLTPKPSGRAVRPLQLLALLVAFLLVAGVGGILGAGLLLPVVATSGAVSGASTDLFNDLPTELEIDEPSQQSVIQDADGKSLAVFFAENRVVVSHDEISSYMLDAVVAVEDRRFYEHNGVDVEGIMRAVVRNVGGDDLQGASTLTQQYVKNVLIEESRVSNDTDLYAAATESDGIAGIARKLREARYAVALEQSTGKEEILTGYLNIAQFGPSQYGVEAAAHYYFNKTSADLGPAEAAMLAGTTQSPAKWDPVRNPDDALQRRDDVLRRMHAQGKITDEENDEALELSIDDMLDVQDTPRGCGVAGDAAYFCQFVVNEVLNSDAYGESREDRRQLLNRGGLTITTTLDPDKQADAFDAVTGSVPVNDSSGIDMAMSAIEPGTGNILAMAQNSTYGQASEDNPGATQVSYNAGQSHGGGQGFQSGSTFKVFTLVEWLRTGHSLNERVNSDNRHFPRADWNISCAPELADDWDPKNLEGFGGGQMTVLESTRMSVNTAYVVMASQMDLCGIRDVAADMGVRNGEGNELEPRPSMVLGTNNVTPLSMANAYATLAAGGTACEPRSVTAMTSANGTDIPVPEPSCERVLDADVVDGANHALQSVTTKQGTSTGAAAHIEDRPTAGKTGTANEDKHAWFIGFIPQMSAAVWMGHADQDEQMGYETINGQYRERVFGGLIAAPTWREFMINATEGMPVEDFADAPDKYVDGEKVSVPNVVGRSVDDAQASLEDAGFSVRVGSATGSAWPQGTVAEVSPSGEARRGETVTITPSSGQAPAPQDRSGNDNDDNDADDGDNNSARSGRSSHREDHDGENSSDWHRGGRD